MNRDVAKLILSATYRSGRELADLLPFIKEHCKNDDYDWISTAIATVLHDLDSKIRRPIFQELPEVERELEDRIERFGRAS